MKLKLSLAARYGLLAVLASALLRLIPVVLAWPYPVGYDTTVFYIVAMRSPLPNVEQTFTQGLLLPIILTALYRIYPQPFLLDDVLGIAIQATLAYSVYIYARKVAELKPKFAFFAAFIFSFDLLTLRLTWDQYRMSLSLVCVIFVFIFLRSKYTLLRYLSIPLTAIATIFNVLPVVFLVFSLTLDALLSFRNISSKIFFELGCIGLALFLISIQYVTRTLVAGNAPPFAAIPGSGGIPYGLEFLLYAAWPILVFLPLLLIKRQKELHLFWFYVLLFFSFVAPLVGVLTISSLWILWLAGFPLAIVFGQTLSLYNNSRILKVVAAALLISSVSISAIYVSSSPLEPRYLPSVARTYATNSPPGYLESTVPISEEGQLLQVLNSTMQILPNGSTVLLPEQFYGLALTSPNHNNLNLSDIGPSASLSEFSRFPGDYIVWWNVSAVPQNYKIISNNEDFALFSIE